jgi:hypothetical protein
LNEFVIYVGERIASAYFSVSSLALENIQNVNILLQNTAEIISAALHESMFSKMYGKFLKIFNQSLLMKIISIE